MRASHVSFRAIGFYVITLSLMVLLFGLSIRLGTYTLSFEEIWAAFQPDDKNYFTLMEYRLPRAVLAILLGGSLAISGVLVQSVVRNPLASPDILGINNAAGLIAVSVLMFLPNLAFYWMPIFAFLGGVLSFANVIDAKTEPRKDLAPEGEKRVELHVIIPAYAIMTI